MSIYENHDINKFIDEDDDQFGEIDASQQFGQPPPTVHGLLLNYGNARHTALNYNTADTLPLSVAVLTHYALVHSANSGRVDHCWRARHCGAAPVVGTRGRSGQREGRASIKYRTVQS